MKTKNRYRKLARLDNGKTKENYYFLEDLTSIKTAKLLGLNRKTVDNWYNYIRKVIYYYSEVEKQEKVGWIIELDESYFGPTRVRGKRRRGAGLKTIVFGFLKRD